MLNITHEKTIQKVMCSGCAKHVKNTYRMEWFNKDGFMFMIVTLCEDCTEDLWGSLTELVSFK